MQARRTYHSYQHNHVEQQQHAVADGNRLDVDNAIVIARAHQRNYNEPGITMTPYPLVSPNVRWQREGVAVARDKAYMYMHTERERMQMLEGMVLRSMKEDREERHRDTKGFFVSTSTATASTPLPTTIATEQTDSDVGAAKNSTTILSPPVPSSKSFEGFSSNRADERSATASVGIMSPVPPPLIQPAPAARRAVSTALLSISSPRRLRLIGNSPCYEEKGEEEESLKNTNGGGGGNGNMRVSYETVGTSYFDFNSFVTSPPTRRGKRDEIGGKSAFGGDSTRSGRAVPMITPAPTLAIVRGCADDEEEEEDGVVAALRSHYESPTVLATFKGLRRGVAGERNEEVIASPPKTDGRKVRRAEADSEESKSPTNRVARSLHADKKGNDTEEEERIADDPSRKGERRSFFSSRDRPTLPSAGATSHSTQSVGDRLWSLHQTQLAKREARALQLRVQEAEEIRKSHTFCPTTNNRDNQTGDELTQHEGHDDGNNNVFRRLSTPTTTPNQRTKGQGRVSHHTTHSHIGGEEEEREVDEKHSSQQAPKGGKKLSKAEADALFKTQMEWEVRRKEKMQALQAAINEQKAGERPGTPRINSKSRQLAESRFINTAAPAVAGDVESTCDDKGRGSSSSSLPLSIRKLKVEDRLVLGESARQDRLRELAAKVAAEERGRPRSQSGAHRSGRKADDTSSIDKNGDSPEKERGYDTSSDKAFERLYIDAAERRRRELEMERAAVFGEWAEAALAATYSRDSSKRSSWINPLNAATAADAPFAPQINARSAALVDVGPTMALVRGEKSGQQLEKERLAREERRHMRMRAAEATRSSSVSRPSLQSEQNGPSHASTPRRSSTPPSSRPATSTINPVSAAIATNRLVRCGMAHMPVHERLSRVAAEVDSTSVSNGNNNNNNAPPAALNRKLKPTTEIPIFTFTPQINNRSRALDEARNGVYSAAANNSDEEEKEYNYSSSTGEEAGGPPRPRSVSGQRKPQQTLDRVDLLHRSYEASKRRLEAAREQRAAEEEEKLRKIREESALMFSKRMSSSALSHNGEDEPYGARRENKNGQQINSFEERAAAWEMRRTARVEHQRRVREEMELAGCTFAPRTTKAPLFVHGSH